MDLLPLNKKERGLYFSLFNRSHCFKLHLFIICNNHLFCFVQLQAVLGVKSHTVMTLNIACCLNRNLLPFVWGDKYLLTQNCYLILYFSEYKCMHYCHRTVLLGLVFDAMEMWKPYNTCPWFLTVWFHTISCDRSKHTRACHRYKQTKAKYVSRG